MSWRSSWARLGLVALAGIVVFAGWSSYQQYERSTKIQREIDILRRESDRIARENETLSEKIQYFASPNFKEEEAKEKLGLRRQEEKVVGIDGDVRITPEIQADTISDAVMIEENQPNYLKWRDRFLYGGTRY